jgi:hypothetical protein
MAKIGWAQVCELAFIDKYDRLCMIGVTTRFPVPSLPLFVRQLMIAARIVDVQPVDSFPVAVSVATPSQRLVPDNMDGFDVNIVGEYILISLRDVPLSEEGLYRFEVSIGDNEPVPLELTVGLVAQRPDVNIQKSNTPSVVFEQPSRLDVN